MKGRGPVTLDTRGRSRQAAKGATRLRIGHARKLLAAAGKDGSSSIPQFGSKGHRSTIVHERGKGERANEIAGNGDDRPLRAIHVACEDTCPP